MRDAGIPQEKGKPLVNILLSTYNGEKYIEAQMDSLIQQSYRPIHIYIRDDGSADQTLEKLKQYQKYDYVTVVPGENIGVNASFHALAALAEEGAYWAFCDQDDLWFQDKVLHGVTWLEAQPTERPLLYACQYERVEGDTLRSLGFFRPSGQGFCFRQSLTDNIYSGFTMMFNHALREWFLRLPPKEIALHDHAVAILAHGVGTAHMEPSVDAKYRIHRSNASAVSLGKRWRLFVKLFQEENYLTKQARALRTVLWDSLSSEEQKYLRWITNPEKNRFKKALFPHRWSHLATSELALRFLMLCGKV